MGGRRGVSDIRRVIGKGGRGSQNPEGKVGSKTDVGGEEGGGHRGRREGTQRSKRREDISNGVRGGKGGGGVLNKSPDFTCNGIPPQSSN